MSFIKGNPLSLLDIDLIKRLRTYAIEYSKDLKCAEICPTYYAKVSYVIDRITADEDGQLAKNTVITGYERHRSSILPTWIKVFTIEQVLNSKEWESSRIISVKLIPGSVFYEDNGFIMASELLILDVEDIKNSALYNNVMFCREIVEKDSFLVDYIKEWTEHNLYRHRKNRQSR